MAHGAAAYRRSATLPITITTLCLTVMALYLLLVIAGRDDALQNAQFDLDRISQGLAGDIAQRLSLAHDTLDKLAVSDPARELQAPSLARLTDIAPWIDAIDLYRNGEPVFLNEQLILSLADPAPGEVPRKLQFAYRDPVSGGWKVAILTPVAADSDQSVSRHFLTMRIDLDFASDILRQTSAATPLIAAVIDTRARSLTAPDAMVLIHPSFPGRQDNAMSLAQYFAAGNEGEPRVKRGYLGSFSDIAGSPLQLALARPADAVLVDWREDIVRHGIIAGAVCAVLLLWGVTRQSSADHGAAADILRTQFEAVADASREAIQIIALDGRPVFSNRAWLDMLDEAQSGHGIGSVAEVLCDEAGDVWRSAVLPSVLSGHGWEGTLRLSGRTGDKERLLWQRADLLPQVGRQPLILCIMHDVTDQREETQNLRRERDAAERANYAKSDFLASMSHELRTPLNAILGFAQLLEMDVEKSLGDKQRQHIGYIMSSGKHLLSLIDDVLDLSKVEAGSIDVSTEPALITTLLEDGLATLRPVADSAGARINIENETAPRDGIITDVDRFHQVFMNIAGNAVKYNRAENPELTIRVAVIGGQVRFSFIDTGLGIPAEQIGHLFEPFNRLGREQGKIEGTGIGLTITKRLVELMDGSIGVESREGEGSHFWIDMPIAETALGAAGGAEIVSLRDARLHRAQRGGYTVLYVEDNVASRDLMAALLDSLPDVHLLSADNAEDGLVIAERERPDVIVMDIGLPGMSGIEAMERIKADATLSHIPVIALSAAAHADDLARGGMAGFVRYLTKPVDMRSLLAALTAALEHPQRRSEKLG